MRVFVAGATGVIGVRLVPLLVAAGHEVVGMTRTAEKAESLRRLSADPFVCDVFDREALGQIDADVVIDQPPDPPRVHIDEAARRTMEFLDAEPGIVTVVE